MECRHSRIHSGSSRSTFSAAKWHDADEVPRIVALQIFPPEESSSRVSIAGIFAPLSSSTDLCVMVYFVSGTFSENRNLEVFGLSDWVMVSMNIILTLRACWTTLYSLVKVSRLWLLEVLPHPTTTPEVSVFLTKDSTGRQTTWITWLGLTGEGSRTRAMSLKNGGWF